jgi:hypothetical protein
MDDDCASEACDIDSGQCVAGSRILYASPTGAATATCEKGDPCALPTAFGAVDTIHDTIKMEAGNYIENITVANKNVSVFGAGATLDGQGGSAILANSDTTLRVVGLTITAIQPGGGGISLRNSTGANRPTLMLENANITAASSAVFCFPCDSDIRASHLEAIAPMEGGIPFEADGVGVSKIDRTLLKGTGRIGAGTGASVQITNSIIVIPAVSSGALATDRASLTVSFSSLIDSTIIDCTSTAPPQCAGGAGRTGSCIKNSVFLDTRAGAPADTIVSGLSCTVDFSIVFPQQSTLNGTGNLIGVNPSLTDPAHADYHLLPGSPAIDVADPASSPSLDFDGTPRPQGLRSDMGALELKQ